MEKKEKDPRQEELNRLQKLYWERDKQFEKAKGKRTILTILGFVAFYYCIIYMVWKPSGIDMLYILIPAVVIGAFHFFINCGIFVALATKGREEAEILDSIKKRIIELEKEKDILNYNDWRDG